MKQVALILTVAFGLNRTAISRVLSFILKYIMFFEKKNKSKGSIETQGKTARLSFIIRALAQVVLFGFYFSEKQLG